LRTIAYIEYEYSTFEHVKQGCALEQWQASLEYWLSIVGSHDHLWRAEQIIHVG